MGSRVFYYNSYFPFSRQYIAKSRDFSNALKLTQGGSAADEGHVHERLLRDVLHVAVRPLQGGGACAGHLDDGLDFIHGHGHNG